jgi:hypothetical protein
MGKKKKNKHSKTSTEEAVKSTSSTATTATVAPEQKPLPPPPQPPSQEDLKKTCRNPVSTRTLGRYLFRTLSLDATKTQDEKWKLIHFRAKILFSIYLILVQLGWFFFYKPQLSLVMMWLSIQEWIVVHPLSFNREPARTDLVGSVFTMGVISTVVSAATTFPLLILFAEDAKTLGFFIVLISVAWFTKPIEVLFVLWSVLIVTIVLLFNPYYCTWSSLLRLIPAIGVWFPSVLVFTVQFEK